jgi:cation diffusion facilitator family transporter
VLARVLVLNVAVAVVKLVLGYTTGAVSIVSDGFQSLTDSASNVIGLVGMRAARKPPDADHPYGHRKFETLAAAGIFVFMLLAVLEIGRSALQHFASASRPSVTLLTFAVMIVTLGVNVWVVRYEAAQARLHNSELLLADSIHTRTDVYATIGVLVALAGVRLGYPILDPIGGILIAVLIARTGFEIARDTSGILSDHVVIAEEDIHRVVMSVPGVLGCHHIRTRGPIDHVFLDLHVWFPADARLVEAHRVSHVVKDRLMQQFPQIADAIIHIEPPPHV